MIRHSPAARSTNTPLSAYADPNRDRSPSAGLGAHCVADLGTFTLFCCACAVRAAVETARDLGAMADDPAAAVPADRRQLVDRALEGVEGVHGTVGRLHLEGHVVVVATDFANCH